MQHLMMTTEEWFKEWEGNRRLTRKVIETFPEKELFEFSIGGMRTFAEMVYELIQFSVEVTEQLIDNKPFPLDREHRKDYGVTKIALLASWDKSVLLAAENWKKIPQERFQEMFNMYEKLNAPAWKNLLYVLENEIHHRAQGYVYLRALGIEPLVFYDRS